MTSHLELPKSPAKYASGVRTRSFASGTNVTFLTLTKIKELQTGAVSIKTLSFYKSCMARVTMQKMLTLHAVG